MGKEVFILEKKKYFFDFYFNGKEYGVVDKESIRFNNGGFLMNNYVYSLLLKDKNYKKCTKDKNLYELLLSYIPKKKKV